MGRPAINTVFNHGDDKNLFNQIEPAQDRADFLASFVATLETLGGYSESEATAIAEILLPDILTYDYSSSAGFLNGRKLTDDVYRHRTGPRHQRGDQHGHGWIPH
jgi:hypothetical protein